MIEFTNAQVKSPSNDELAGISCRLVLDGMSQVLTVNKLNLTKKAMKGWNIYPTSEMRNIVNVVSSGVKAMSGMIEEYTMRDTVQADLKDANAAMDRVEGITRGKPEIKVNRKELLKHLNASTDEFVVLILSLIHI